MSTPSYLQKDPYSKLSTTRILNETESLNSKVNQYRQALSIGFPQNASLNMSMYARTNSAFNPKCNINTLNSLSNTFQSMTQKPVIDIPNMNNDYNGSNQNILAINLKQSYEKHINDLYSNFKTCLSKLEEIAFANKIDIPIVKKVINDNLFYERENQIANFIEEISELKTQKQNDLQKSFEMELQKKQEENENEIDRLQKVISVLEIDLNASENKIKEKNKKIEDLQHEYSNLQSQFFDASLKYKKFLEENTSLKGLVEHYEKERKEFLDKCNTFNNSTNNYSKQQQTSPSLTSSNGVIQAAQNMSETLRSQIDSYVNTINEMKLQNENLENELKKEQDKFIQHQKNYSKAMLEMQDKVKMLSTEWDKKLKTERNDYENIITEIELKHKNQLDNIFQEHQIEIENKSNEILKLKESAELLKNFEKEYIRISEHEKRVNDVISQYKSQYEKEYENKKTSCELELQMKLNKIESDKKMEYDFLTDNIKSNLQRSEKENYDMKNKIIQLENKLNINESQTTSLNKEIQKHLSTITDKNNELEKIKNDISHLEKKISNLEEINATLNNQITIYKQQQLSHEQIEISLKQEQQNKLSLLNEIKNLTNIKNELQSKLKQMNMNHSFYDECFEQQSSTKLKLMNQIKSIRNELTQIKSSYMNDLSQLALLYKNNIDALTKKINMYEQYKNNSLYEINNQNDLAVKEQNYLYDQAKNEIKSLTDTNVQLNLKITDLNFKISEIENENKNYKLQSIKLSKEIDSHSKEKEMLNVSAKAFQKKITNSINEMLLKFTKIKKKYQSEIFGLKAQINNIKQQYEGDIVYIKSLNKDEMLQHKLDLMENENSDNKEIIQKLKIKVSGLMLEKENKEEEFKQLKEMISLKDKTIKELQNIVNQSINSYNAGVNSIKVAKRLNDDVKVLIRKAKAPETNLTTITSDY